MIAGNQVDKPTATAPVPHLSGVDAFDLPVPTVGSGNRTETAAVVLGLPAADGNRHSGGKNAQHGDGGRLAEINAPKIAALAEAYAEAVKGQLPGASEMSGV